MDNTKFTKGWWTVLSNAEYSDVFKIKSDLGFPSFGENEANALLISKAPEMLEMLQDIVYDFYEDGLKVVSIGNIEKAKKLIKQATEL